MMKEKLILFSFVIFLALALSSNAQTIFNETFNASSAQLGYLITVWANVTDPVNISAVLFEVQYPNTTKVNYSGVQQFRYTTTNTRSQTQYAVYFYGFEDANEFSNNYSAGGGWERSGTQKYAGSYACHRPASGAAGNCTYKTNIDLSAYDACNITSTLGRPSADDSGENVCLDYSTNGGTTWTLGTGTACRLDADADQATAWANRTTANFVPTNQVRFQAQGYGARGTNEWDGMDDTVILCQKNVTTIVYLDYRNNSRWFYNLTDLTQLGYYNLTRVYANTTAAGSNSSYPYRTFSIFFPVLNVLITAPTSDTTLGRNDVFRLNASAYCNGTLSLYTSCGGLYAFARYNGSSANPDTIISTTQTIPFFLPTGGAANPQTNASVSTSTYWYVSFLVNYTGWYNSNYSLDVLFNSTYGEANMTSQDTLNIRVSNYSGDQWNYSFTETYQTGKYILRRVYANTTNTTVIHENSTYPTTLEFNITAATSNCTYSGTGAWIITNEDCVLSTNTNVQAGKGLQLINSNLTIINAFVVTNGTNYSTTSKLNLSGTSMINLSG